jgi:ADP-ribose pyrophosphatase YjhB (NUDIX family)/GNAT superfamily N-acetyltransferase
MQRRFAEGRERDVCPACGFVFYRNPVPAVGVVVALDERVVLVRRRYAPREGYWALPAGYMELGESAEEAAIRECHEETGLLIQIDHLLHVFSFGFGDQSGLVIIYAASAVGGALVAGDDATEVGAFALDELPSPFAFRTHLQALDRWRRERRLATAMLPSPTALPPQLRIRYATHADAPAALALLLDGPYEDDERWLFADALFQDRLHAPDHPALIAEWDGAIAGVALLSLHQTLRGWRATLDDLVVARAYRRRGLATTLLRTLAQLAQLRGCLELVALSPRSPEALTFLRSSGFVAGDALAMPLAT